MKCRIMLRWVRWSGALVATGLALGCADPDGSPGPEVVASYRGGQVTLAEAEQWLRRNIGRAAEGDGVDDLVAAYRSAAESVAAGRLLVGDETTDEMLAELGDTGHEIRRRALVAAYLESRLGDLRVGAAEVEAFYAEHRAELHRPAQRNVWHLYRRHRDGSRPDETEALLLELKRRAEAGEGFSQLATQYSDSETRVLGGRLGLLREGRLPAALEAEVFALPAGAISRPLPVPGGLALFYVSDVLEASDYSLEDARATITAHVAESKRRARWAELVADLEFPPGSTVLDIDRVMAALVTSDDAAVVLSVGDFSLTAGELRSRFEREQPPPGSPLEPPPRERLRLAYEDLAHEQLLFLAASDVELPEWQRRRLDESIRQLARDALARQRLEVEVRERASADEAALRRFWDDNRHLYQTPLRLQLQTLVVAAGPDAARTLASMEAVRGELERGAVDFPAAAARVGGTVLELGWVDFATLMTYEPKVRYYVLELNGPGYTVPFQLNRQLSMVWVVAREEPRERPFDEVREQVLADSVERQRQQLFRAALDARLQAGGFRFFEDTVRRVLAPPPAAAAATPGG